jgi:hypothetical protein
MAELDAFLAKHPKPLNAIEKWEKGGRVGPKPTKEWLLAQEAREVAERNAAKRH